MPTHDAPGERRVVGGFERGATTWVLTLFAVGGVTVAMLLPWLAGLATDLPWVPFQGPLELLGSFDDPWLVWGRPVLGLLAGAALGAWVVLDAPVLAVGREEIEVRRRGRVDRVIDRTKVDAVYPRGSKLVIETSSGRTLFDDEVEGDKGAIRAAFVELGYPWEGRRDE